MQLRLIHLHGVANLGISTSQDVISANLYNKAEHDWQCKPCYEIVNNLGMLLKVREEVWEMPSALILSEGKTPTYTS